MGEPLAYIGAWRAVLLTADRGVISAEAAVQLLGEAIHDGEIAPAWPDGRPSAPRAHEIDWRAGVLRRRLRLQACAVSDAWEEPAYTERPRAWPFRLRRAEVEALIAERFGEPRRAERRPRSRAQRERAEQAMRELVRREGKAALDALPVKELAHKYGVGRTLAQQVRKAVLSERP